MMRVMRGKRVQFWGDSTSAQMECDLRAALDEVGTPVPINNASRYWRSLGSRYPDDGASSYYQRIGCPWYCDERDGSMQPQKVIALLPRARDATHVIFNIGAHYQNYSDAVLSKTIHLFAAALRQLRDVTVAIRSPSITHFRATTGEYSATAVATKAPCVQHDRQIAEQPHAARLDAHMRKFQALLTNHSKPVIYLDIRELSDDATQHPKRKDGQPWVGDCLHYCQDCRHGVLRAWNSLMLQRLREQDKHMRPR